MSALNKCIEKDISVHSTGHLSAYTLLPADTSKVKFSKRTQTELDQGKREHDFEDDDTCMADVEPGSKEHRKKKETMANIAYLLVSELYKVRKLITLVEPCLDQELLHLQNCPGVEDVAIRAERYDRLETLIVEIFESYHWIFRTFYYSTDKDYDLNTFQNNLRLSIHSGTPLWANKCSSHSLPDLKDEPTGLTNIVELWKGKAEEKNESTHEMRKKFEEVLNNRWDIVGNLTKHLIKPLFSIYSSKHQQNWTHFHHKNLSFLHISFGYSLFFARHHATSFPSAYSPTGVVESWTNVKFWFYETLLFIVRSRDSICDELNGAGTAVAVSEMLSQWKEAKEDWKFTAKDASGRIYCYEAALKGYAKLFGGNKRMQELSEQWKKIFEESGGRQALAQANAACDKFITSLKLSCSIEDLERTEDKTWAEARRIEASVREFLFSPPQDGEAWEAFETRANRLFFPVEEAQTSAPASQS